MQYSEPPVRYRSLRCLQMFLPRIMLKQLNYGNGLQLTLGYNANRQQPITMKVGPNGTGTILDYSYEYYDAQGHNNNRIRSITDATDSAYSVNYTYDQWNRLTHAAAGAYARYYTYDAFGNLKTVTGSGGPQPNYTLNYAQNATTAPATNRILSVTENSSTQPFPPVHQPLLKPHSQRASERRNTAVQG
jgi:hypothetical protein